MAARKRRSDESFDVYRENLKIEALSDKRRLRGIKVYQATDIMEAPNKKFISLKLTPLEKPSYPVVVPRHPARSQMRMRRNDNGKMVSFRDNTLSPTDRYYTEQ